MNVYKIGGAALKDTSNFMELIELINNSSDASIFVVSAFGKTTRNLSEAAELAQKGEFDKSMAKLESIIDYHKSIINELRLSNFISNIYDMLNDTNKSINKILEGIFITKELTARTKDKILAYGEDLAVFVLNNLFKSKYINIIFIDAKLYLITNDIFGNAEPIYEMTKDNLLKITDINSNQKYLTQGFCGRTLSGETSTMGYESSNLTAVLLASIMNAKELNIITDVDCIYSADPAAVDNAKAIESLSIQTANLLSNNGLKLIYPGMLSYMKNSSFSVKFSSLKANASTYISNSTANSNFPLFISNNNIDLSNESANNLHFNNIVIANLEFYQFNVICNYLSSHNLIPSKLNYESELKFATIISEAAISGLLQELHNLLVNN